MAFMKTSVTPSSINEETLLSGLSEAEIKNLLKRYLDGKNIGFNPTPSLLRKYGF